MLFAKQWLITFSAHVNQADSIETNCDAQLLFSFKLWEVNNKHQRCFPLHRVSKTTSSMPHFTQLSMHTSCAYHRECARCVCVYNLFCSVLMHRPTKPFTSKTQKTSYYLRKELLWNFCLMPDYNCEHNIQHVALTGPKTTLHSYITATENFSLFHFMILWWPQSSNISFSVLIFLLQKSVYLHIWYKECCTFT